MRRDRRLGASLGRRPRGPALRRGGPAAVAALLAALSSGCVPTEFEDLRGEAQTVAFDKPDEYPTVGIGRALAGFGAVVDGVAQSRVAATAGPDTPYVVYSAVLGDALEPGEVLATACTANAPCAVGAGGTLVGLAAWDGAPLCVAAPAPSTGEITIRCEGQEGARVAPGAGGEDFGASGAAVPADHPFGRAVFGAPGGGAGGFGAVYRLPDGAAAQALDLSAGAGNGGGFGTSVAVGVLDEDSALLVTGGTGGRVIVSTHDVDGAGAVSSAVVGCLDDPSPGWGLAVAVGDLNGDGTPDVVVGSGREPDRLEVVRVYDGAQRGAPGTCDGSWAPVTELGCPTVDDAVLCQGAEFGSTLAVGDLNGDGRDDLVVGAPSAEVDETPGAGAVFVFEGSEPLTDLDDVVTSLRLPSPEANASLGRTVATVPGLTDGAPRDEVAAGAPGADRVYLFLCSGLEGDSPDVDSPGSGATLRCQPRE